MATTRKTTKKATRTTTKRRARTDEASQAHAGAAPRSISETAQQIWLAGVGAFGRAQAEGTRLFDGLVRDGAGLEKTARDFATARATEVRSVVETSVDQTRERAVDGWERLETLFEDRVHGVLQQLGVPRREEVEALRAQVDALSRELRSRGAAADGSAKAPARKAAARKAPARKTAHARTPAKPARTGPAKPRKPSRTTSS